MMDLTANKTVETVKVPEETAKDEETHLVANTEVDSVSHLIRLFVAQGMSEMVDQSETPQWCGEQRKTATIEEVTGLYITKSYIIY